jgi:hypothetical protein
MSLDFENINLGATAGDKTGDGARTGGGKINRNFEKVKAFLETPDAILVQTGYELVGQNLNFETGWKWRIDAVEYTNPADVVLNFPLAASGKSRLDLVVLTTSNTFLRVPGAESTTTPVAPSTPSGSLYVTVVFVSDGAVTQPQPPEVNGAFVQKSERNSVILTGSGIINQLDLVDEKATVVFKGTVTRLNTILYNTIHYNGKPLRLMNLQNTPVTIGHGVSGFGVDFVFPDGQDYVLEPNQTIEFSYDLTYLPYAHHMFIGNVAKKTTNVTTEPNITKTLAATDEHIVFSNANAVTFTIPTNASVPIPVGTKVRYTQQGNGAVTVGGAGITFVTNLPLAMVKGETRVLTKIGVDTWGLEGGSDMATNVAQNVTALKTFLNGMLGLRNVANTITSFFSNSATVARTWTFPDKNGTVAMTSDIPSTGYISGGIANYISKFLTSTTVGISRLFDNGVFFGIGTSKTPLKDFTLGNQNNREIGVEESSNITEGRNLKVSAGRTINYVENSIFNMISPPLEFFSYGLCSTPSGNIYGVGLNNVLYKQTSGSGLFVNVGTPFPTNAIAICSDSSNNLYVAIQNGDIYKQTNETGPFVALGQTPRAWFGLCSLGSNIYASVNNGDIYRQTGGVGNFLALGQVSRAWGRMASSSTSIYALAGAAGIYKLTNQTGNFNLHSSATSGGIAISASNDIYINSGTDMLKQTIETGAFVSTGSTVTNNGIWGMAVHANGNIYAGDFSKNMFVLQNSGAGTANLNGGSMQVVAGTGKGNGKSRVEFYTGQKKPSGTDMQVETLREYIDENGYHVYTSMPIFADNAAAIAGGLPVGCEYRTATGVKMIVY